MPLPILIPANPYDWHADATEKEQRDAATAFSRQLVGTTITNGPSGHVISVSAKGIRHSLSRARTPLIRALSALRPAIEQARHIGSFADKANRPDIIAVHKYQVELEDSINAQKLLALITVREHRGPAGTTLKNFYDLSFLAA